MIIFLDGEEAACTTIQTQRVCDSFSHDSGASAILLGSIPNFPTPWERRIAALVWGV